jgi:L-fuconolactonase
MKIDAHQHFWIYNSSDYPWISGTMESLKRDFLPSDLRKELDGLNFDGTVAVQARQSLEETDWLLGLAAKYSFIKGVIGWVDLCSPDLQKQIERFLPDKKFVGVRHVLHDEADELFMLKESFLRGISLLESYGLVYDILIFPVHIPHATELVRRFPRQKFVLDHIAKPDIRNRIFSPWERQIKELATNQNLYCKLSGMVTEADLKGWKKDDFKPFLDVIFESFGPWRLMIGSDWPVCTLSAAYRDTMEIVTDYIRTLNREEKDAILGNNAISVYNLNK